MSPECNPIENIFGIIKQRFYICRVHPTTRDMDIRNLINQIVDEKTNVANVSGAFGHMVRIVTANDFVRCN
jgi:hypothetical protein